MVGPVGAIEAFTIDGYGDDRMASGAGHVTTGKILGGVLLAGAAGAAILGALQRRKEEERAIRRLGPSYYGIGLTNHTILTPPPKPKSPAGLGGRQIRKGWRKRMPHSGLQRRELKDRCGSNAFLDPEGLKYPVMSKSCSFDCQAVLSAFRRAKQQASMSVNAGLTQDAAYHNRMAAKAKRLGLKISCPVKAWQRSR